REAIALVGDDVFRISAVEVVTGEACSVAEVLAAARAVPARAVRPPEPRDAESPAVVGHPDDLMAGDERQLGMRQLAVDDVQIGAADPAGLHAQAYLARPRLGDGKVAQLERLALRGE